MANKKWKNKNFRQALKHSIKGIKYAFTRERNLKIQLIFAIIAIIMAVVLKLSSVEFMILVLAIGFVIFAEMVNTAIEFVFDLYSQENNKIIKIGKDIASRSSSNYSNCFCYNRNYIICPQNNDYSVGAQSSVTQI